MKYLKELSIVLAFVLIVAIVAVVCGDKSIPITKP